jgi:hypothetical protein
MLSGTNMIRKWFKRILIVFGVLVIIVVTFIGIAVFDLWYHNSYKSHIQTLEVPDRKIQFVLLTDICGIGDPAWYVYKLPIGVDITKRMKTAYDTEDVLFWNYSELGDHCDNPKIEIIGKKYLVFTRGGLRHSLYDIEKAEVLVNDECPWAASLTAEEAKGRSGRILSYEEEMKRMDVWVRENLHSKIEKILNDTK